MSMFLNRHLSFTLNSDRQAYIFCFEGSIDIVGYPSLKERDSLEIFGQADPVFSLASDKAHFIIIEMQKVNSSSLSINPA